MLTIERFWRSMKDEFVDPFFVYRFIGRLDRDLALYRDWFNRERPHWTLGGRAPDEIEASGKRREPRPKSAAPVLRSPKGEGGRLVVSHLGGDRRLPVLRLRRAA